MSILAYLFSYLAWTSSPFVFRIRFPPPFSFIRFRIGSLLSWIRISSFFCGFRRLLIREFILISPVSVRDQAFRASSLIVHSLYKLYKFLGSSLVEFSTWCSSPFMQSNGAR